MTQQASQTGQAPLSGLRVLDLTTFLSGPFCTQILADLGADVVKLEPPSGDSSRHIPPYFVDRDSAYFLASNRSKRSVSVDMKHPEGIALVRRLIGTVDVVVENFRPDVPARLGLDIAALRKQHPGLIWASITGFGLEGPWANRPAYDMIVQALSGVMSLTGEPEGKSVRLGIPAGDTVAGLYAAVAINAALVQRGITGQGRHIDVAMLDCQLSMLSYQSAYALIGGAKPGRQGAGHDSIPTYRTFTAGDGRDIAVTANTEKMWKGLCAALGRSDLVDDPRFADGPSRLANRVALWAELEPAFLARNGEEWADLLTEHDVPNALIRTVPEALDDARQSGRGMIVELAEGVDVVGSPIRMGQGVPAPAGYPPALGGDAESVLSDWLGAASAEVDAMRKAGVLKERGQ
ncbi:CaiB/BaiF CoA transferase family protein [Oceaniglobus trochenteri]|uniref:CaiB/BaiF CoA transferase family protein n=1 Tax=Oceaniglobus trochenteri TaxID=2763260 RepID=UPI001CFF7771|nr:CoA transferase [Oceaniglobus trochenteri]